VLYVRAQYHSIARKSYQKRPVFAAIEVYRQD
jgi:hypothetical protein